MAINSYDGKLLFELDKDASLNISNLAKKLRRSKQFVLYRIKKLEEQGIITGYHAIVDMSRLGYFTFRVYLRLQHMDKKDQQELINQAKKQPHIWTITSMHGKWDLALFLGVKNIAEFHTIWDSLLKEYKQNISAYNVAIYAPIINFNRKFFIDTKETVERIYGAGKAEKIDETDLAIIEEYAPNVRKNSTEIASKLKLSPDTVRSHINHLEKSKIIVGYKLGLDLEKLGYVSYRVDLHLSSTKRNNELTEFCKQHKNIYQINKTIGGADFEIEATVKDLQHLLNVIDEIKTRFKEVIIDADWFGFSTFHVLKYIPD